ncbi:translation initiation factor IF-2-like [Mustela putorius furo]|uniref:Translation initiation factor IF-2-like n=1 Tax=Mustela putorius furo TaxID=9669 RepID=A0A8U0V701_MUSPF|nr:translation initiation factor IF-2-like [Mustela putorius furo]
MLNRRAPPLAAPSSGPQRACSAARPGSRRSRAAHARRPTPRRRPRARSRPGWTSPAAGTSGLGAWVGSRPPSERRYVGPFPARVHLSAVACSDRGGPPAAGTCGAPPPRGARPAPAPAGASGCCPAFRVLLPWARAVRTGVFTAPAGRGAPCVGRRGSRVRAGVGARAPRGPQDPSRREPFRGPRASSAGHCAPPAPRPELAAGGTRRETPAGPSGSAWRRAGPPAGLECVSADPPGPARSWPGTRRPWLPCAGGRRPQSGGPRRVWSPKPRPGQKQRLVDGFKTRMERSGNDLKRKAEEDKTQQCLSRNERQ